MNTCEKALEMRSAINAAELAMSGMNGFEDLARFWEGVSDIVMITVHMTVGQVRQFHRAYAELNRIINSPEYAPSSL